MKKPVLIFFFILLLISFIKLQAQNPLIMDQFTADPTARLFEGKVYVYPSHDINCGTNWFCMEDYHVFSSENLVDWTDHGVILTQEKVEWVDPERNSMWAPDCIEKNGRYYFYFPAIADSSSGVRGMAIGVAISDTPIGQFVPEPLPIEGVHGIDPNVFIDKDGQAYLYWAGMGNLLGARLKENLLDLATEPQVIQSLPEGFKEGPFLFERNGIYYFTFPHVIEKTEALVYAIGDNPMGPFEYKGIIMDEFPNRCWTIHQSMLEYRGQWYLFYHHNDLSPNFDKNRSICADSLFFNEDGTIRKVVPTFRGVGLTQATDQIQIDRYSDISDRGADIMFLDTADTFRGWKTVLEEKEAWVKYNGVDFGHEKLKSVNFRARSESGATVKLRVGAGNGSEDAEVKIPAGTDWTTVNKKIKGLPGGVRNVVISLAESGPVEIDWIRFE